MVASMAESLDEVCGGRLILGIGSGVGPSDDRWAELGYDSARHVGRFVEAVEITARLLRQDEPLTFEGEFFRLAGAKPKPQGPRPGGPPLWIAAGKPRTLGVAARWGDAVNWAENLTGVESVREALAAVAQACGAAGRDPTTLPLTACVRLEMDKSAAESRPDSLAGDVVEVIAKLEEMHAAGLRHVTIFSGEPDDTGPFPAPTRGRSISSPRSSRRSRAEAERRRRPRWPPPRSGLRSYEAGIDDQRRHRTGRDVGEVEAVDFLDLGTEPGRERIGHGGELGERPPPGHRPPG